jgi:nitrogen fixation protein NifU and related proteins
MKTSCLEGFSEVARDHATHPRNYGPPEDFDGHARMAGPCGNTMEFWLAVQNGRVLRAFFVTGGSESSLACGSITTCLTTGRSVVEAMAIGQRTVLEALGGLPGESEHCALLATNTLKAACGDYVNNRD